MNKPSTLSKETSLVLVAAAFVFLHPYTARAQSVSFTGAQTTLNVSVGGSGLNYPYGVAVDGAGNVFIADSGNNRVVEVPAGGGAQTTVGSGLSGPDGVAVDGAGDVFIADTMNSRVVKVPWTGTSWGTQTTLSVSVGGIGLSYPEGVAVDGAGDVFIADTYNNRVVKVPAGGGAQTTVDSGLSLPAGVAVDGAGNVFIADTGNSRVVEVQWPAVNFGSVNICPGGQTTPAPCSQTLTLSYNINETTTFGSNPAVLTQGAPNLDFSLSSTICTGTITAPGSCTVNVSFAPLAPGLRMGGVQIKDSSGNLLVTTLVHGIGEGPAMAFGPGAQTTLTVSVGGIGLNEPTGVAVDGAGDVFISDFGNNRVVEVPAAGGAQSTLTVSVGGKGLNSPFGVAVDGAGDVFIADYYNWRVVEVPAGGGTQTTVGSGLNYPTGVAVDGAGNVFIADTGNWRVVEVPAGGGAQTTVGSGLNGPAGVAVDGAGDVFIADEGNNRVVEVPWTGTGYGAQTTVGSGLNAPVTVAVDGAGDVFIADTNNSRVVEVPAGGGAQTTLGSGLYMPYGVALDGAGDVFIADFGNNRVVEVLRSEAPTFSFATTEVGSTSTDSPQSVTVQNIGNQTLDAVSPGLSIGSNSFEQVAGSGASPDCTSSFSLQPGASCNLSVSFIPQTTGSIVSAATFTDNALNATAATQSVSLSGTGINPAATFSPTSVAFGNELINTASVVKNVFLTSSGTTNLSKPSITITGTNAPDFSQTNTCTAASYAPGAKCTISVTFTPSMLAAESASLMVTDNASNSPQTVPLTGTGVMPVVLSPTSLSFGNLGEGDTSASKTITLTNYLKVSLAGINVSTGSTDYPQTNTCGTSVAAGKTCTITVTFKPSIVGADDATLSISDSASNSPQRAALTGTGEIPVTLSLTTLAFGKLGEGDTSAGKTITVTNDQNVALTGIKVSTTSTDYPQTNTCGTSVAAGKTCKITVTFKPSIIGTDDATLSISDSAVNTPQTAALTGTGIIPVTLSLTTLAFDNVAEGTTSAAKTITVTNFQNVALTGIKVSTTSTDYPQTNTCGASIDAGKRCTITVTFKPSIIGTDDATLSITDSAVNSPQTAALTGTGLSPATLTPTSDTFVTEKVGATSPAKVLTLTSYLETTLTGIVISTTGDFSVSSTTCTTSLAAKGKCTIDVVFKPTATGTRTGTLKVTDSAANSPQTSTLTGTGK